MRDMGANVVMTAAAAPALPLLPQFKHLSSKYVPPSTLAQIWNFHFPGLVASFALLFYGITLKSLESYLEVGSTNLSQWHIA